MKAMVRALAGAWTRRRLLAAGATVAALSADDRLLPSERIGFIDGTTEFEVSRLTAPAYSSFLPPPHVQQFSRHRGAFLLISSDRGGSLQAYLLDLKTWQMRLLTEAAALDAASLCLSPDGRLLCFRDGDQLCFQLAGSARQRVVYGWPSEAAGSCVQVLPEGPSALIVESKTRLRVVNLIRSTTRTVCEYNEPILDQMPRPKRAAAAFRTASGTLVMAHLDGSRTFTLKTPPGVSGPMRWAPDGRALLYLHRHDAASGNTALREINPDSGEDRLIAQTSQFAQFSPNGDASVFVGASRSRAQPDVLLLLRSVRRELTLCSHKASDAAAVAPVFSPDSQRIFFQSDREGKPAIYSMSVERLVEKTDSQ